MKYMLLHATRAELLRRLHRLEDARAAYDRALELVHSDPSGVCSNGGWRSSAADVAAPTR